MGVYRRGSVKPVPLTVAYWFRVRGFKSLHSHIYRFYKSFLGVGKKLGVSDNAIRKWCRRNGLPDDKKNIMKYVGSNPFTPAK